MGKSGIRKALKITAWVVGVFLALDLLLVGLLFVPSIQTFIVHKVTESLSDKWGTEISIGDIHITPTLKLVAHEVNIKDHHNEKMIYSGTVKGRLRSIKTKPFKLGLGNVKFDDLDVVLRTYQNEESINIAVWAKNFKSGKKKEPFTLTSNSVDITNGRFVLIMDDKRVVYETSGQPDIDYAFLELANLNVKAKDFKLVGADVAMKFKQLAFNQYGGFQLQKGSGDFRICDTTLTFTDLKLKTPQSDLDLDLYFRYDRWKTYGEFLDSVRISAEIRPSVLAMDDIADWAPAIRGMNEVFQLQADTVDGVVTDFALKNVKAGWNGRNLVQGDIALQNIIHFMNARFDVALDSTVVHVPDLASFTLPGGKTIKSNATLDKLGTTTLSGSFKGILSQFNLKMLAATGLGTVNAALSTSKENGRLVFDGEASSNNFNLARLVNNHKLFGTCQLGVKFDGRTDTTGLTAKNLKTMKAHLKGNVNRFPLMGYPIRNISIEGDYQEGLYNASLRSNDPNFVCEAIAQLDNTQNVPFTQGSITLERCAAGKIGQQLPLVDSATAKGIDKFISIMQRNPSVELSFDRFQVSLHGSKLNNINGYLACDNIKLHYNEDSLSNDRMRLTAINNDYTHKYIFASNIANATLESSLPLEVIKDTLQNIAHNLLPSLVPEVRQSMNTYERDLAFSVPDYIKINLQTYNTRAVTKLFFPEMFISPNSIVRLEVNEGHQADLADIQLPFFGIRNKFRIHNLKAHGKTNGTNNFDLNVNGDSLVVVLEKNKLLLDKMYVTANGSNNNIQYDLSWHNPFNAEENISNLSGSANIENMDDIVIQLNPSKVFLKDYECHFNDQNQIHIQPHRYDIDNLLFYTQDSYVSVNGTYDTKDSSRLSMAVKNFELSLINQLLNGISFGGRLSADLNLMNRNNRRFIFGKAITDELVMNDTRLGDLFLMAGLNNNNQVRFSGGLFNSESTTLDYDFLSNFSIRDFQEEGSIIANISGSYEKKEFVVNADFDSLQADFLEPFLSSFSDEFSGKASGKLSFHASPDSSYLDGNVHVINAKMGISAIGTKYTVEDQDITFNKEGIFFQNMQIFDMDKNRAYMSGEITHNMFKDMQLDLQITSDRIMALNTPRTTNSVFYGKGYVKGDVYIFGSGDQLSFVGPSLQTLSGSKITLQVTSTNMASETNAIHFNTRKDVEEPEETPKKSSTKLNFDFTFNVTNDADVVIYLESIGGTINARTDGQFQLVYNSNDALNLYGNLLLHSGDVKISLYNVVNTKFIMVPGGTINFDGPLDNMNVHLGAYKSSKTSLTEIIPSTYLSSGNVDVDAYMYLDGPLMKRIEPTFKFELPNSSNEVRNMFYTAIDTQNTENMTKQFAYFLVTNSFMPDNMFAGNSNISALTGLGLFSNVINNLLSNVIDSKYGSFGITYNQATETTSAEYGLKANANILKDRVTMSTRIGYYDDQTATDAYQNIYGNFTVEYNINKSGTWRLKAYTYIGDRDNTYFYENNYNNYTAGVALAYKQDFDNRRRIKNRKTALKETKKQ